MGNEAIGRPEEGFGVLKEFFAGGAEIESIKFFGQGIERIDNICCVHAARQLEFYFYLFRRIVVNFRNFYFSRLRRRFYRSDEAFGSAAEREFTDNNPFIVGGVQLCPHQHLALAVLIVGHVDKPAGLKVGIEGKGFTGKAVFFRLDDFADIMRKYLGRHTDGDSFRPDK